MTDTRVVSNKVVEVRIGIDSAIADILAPTAPELNAMLSANEAMRWDQFDLNVQASSMGEDPTLADAAGSQIRELLQFGGTASFLQKHQGDTTSIAARIHDLTIKPHTKLVVAIRGLVKIGTAATAGEVWNVFRVTTDAETRERGDSGYSYRVNFRPRGDAGINVIVPSASPTAVAITVPATATVGTPISCTALYEGNDITVGAKWESTDENVLEVLPHGWAIPKTAGSASITATYPGSAAGVATEVTVS